MDLSFDDLQDVLSGALCAKFGSDSFGTPLYCLVEAFPDYLIARGPNQELFRVDYEVDSDDGDMDADDVTLGDPQQVEVAYVPVAQSARFLAQEAAATDEWAYPVQVMEAGWAHGAINGATDVPHYFPPEVIAQVAEAVNGAKFGRAHPKDGLGADQPERIAGWCDGGKVVGTAARGVVHLLQNETDLQAKLSAARKAGKMDLFGLSVLALFGFKAGKAQGKDALVATRLGKLVSVDLCADAGAGGKFLPYAASGSLMAEISTLQKASVVKTAENPAARSAGRQIGAAMKDRIVKMIEALRKRDAGRATQLSTEFATAQEAGYPEFLLKVTEAAQQVMEQSLTAADAAALVAESRTALDEMKKLRSQTLLETKLTASKLPAAAVKLAREHLAGRVVDEAEIDGEIKRVREAFASFSTIGRVGVGAVEVGLEGRDKVQLAMDAMLGVKEAVADKNVRAFRGIKEAYIACTGDRDMAFGRGGIGGFTKVTEAIATTDFPNILLDSMTKKLIQDYMELGMAGLDQLITSATLTDYKIQNRVRMGYYGDLPTVAQAGPYTELNKPTDELITYSPSKKGGLVTISEETIRNDDLGKIRQIPQRLARAGRHTLKSFITTTFFTGNPNYAPDGLSWFNAAHNNLGASPLGVDNLVAVEQSLMLQTEKDSGHALGWRIEWVMVAPQLAATAWGINNDEKYYPGPMIAKSNPFYQRFGPPGQGKNSPKGIIVNELLAAAPHTWYYGIFPDEAPMVEIGYLDGIEQPQIFLADLQTQGTQFTNDQIQYKTKFVFGGAILDFRPVGQQVVP